MAVVQLTKRVHRTPQCGPEFKGEDHDLGCYLDQEPTPGDRLNFCAGAVLHNWVLPKRDKLKSVTVLCSDQPVKGAIKANAYRNWRIALGYPSFDLSPSGRDIPLPVWWWVEYTTR